MSAQAYKFLVSASCTKKLQVASFKNWINVLETKSYFSSYLPFCLFLAEKIIFLSNIFTFVIERENLTSASFYFQIFSNSLLICLLISHWRQSFIFDEVLLLYILLCSNLWFFYFPFWWLLRVKKHINMTTHRVLNLSKLT